MAAEETYTQMLKKAGVDDEYYADLFPEIDPVTPTSKPAPNMEYRGGTVPVPAKAQSQALDPAYR